VKLGVHWSAVNHLFKNPSDYAPQANALALAPASLVKAFGAHPIEGAIRRGVRASGVLNGPCASWRSGDYPALRCRIDSRGRARWATAGDPCGRLLRLSRKAVACVQLRQISASGGVLPGRGGERSWPIRARIHRSIGVTALETTSRALLGSGSESV